jgi:hypothetical protein
MGEKRRAYIVMFGTPEGKRHLGRLWCMWMDGIEMDFREMV